MIDEKYSHENSKLWFSWPFDSSSWTQEQFVHPTQSLRVANAHLSRDQHIRTDRHTLELELLLLLLTS